MALFGYRVTVNWLFYFWKTVDSFDGGDDEDGAFH